MPSSTTTKIFRFTISDLGLFLGKSPVTIRAWERKEFIAPLPRNGLSRSMDCETVYKVAQIARQAGRISEERMWLIQDVVMALRAIETENQ